jgi:hypothetical protein
LNNLATGDMTNKFEKLDENDVISVNPESFDRLDVSKTLTAIELIEAIKDYMGSDDTEAKLFTAGMDVKVLRPGDGWKKGKIRVGIEFCPDETKINTTIVNNNLGLTPAASPLDDLRNQLKDIQN